MIYRHVAGISLEGSLIYVWEILALPTVSDVHLRKIVCRYLLVLLNIDAIPGGLHFVRNGRNLNRSRETRD